MTWEKALALKLTYARRSLGYSQSELARKCGLHPSAIAHFEASRRVPSLKNFQRLCDATETDPRSMLPVLDGPNRKGSEGQ
jgi:transcriptional regulator with XRE-family HTH domain